MTAVVVLALVWLVGISLILAMLKRATCIPWWEQTRLDIDALPTTNPRARQLLD